MQRSGTDPYTSHLAVFTVPPAVFQGIGKSVEAAREDAAAKALVSLVQSGFTKSTMGADKDE